MEAQRIYSGLYYGGRSPTSGVHRVGLEERKKDQTVSNFQKDYEVTAKTPSQ